MCRFNRLGRSNALPQTSHGRSARSPRAGRGFVERLNIIVVSKISLLLLATDDEIEDSPDTDLCSSSPPDGGEIGNRTRDSNDMERSRGESENKENGVII